MEKQDWMKYLENGEYLRAAEITEEQNYNMIDGKNNNRVTNKADTKAKAADQNQNERPSVLGSSKRSRSCWQKQKRKRYLHRRKIRSVICSKRKRGQGSVVVALLCRKRSIKPWLDFTPSSVVNF